MKLSFRGAIYESPFPTLELSENPLADYNNGLLWRLQHLKAFMAEQGHKPTLSADDLDEGEDNILLAIWEPAPTTDTRTRPFLFVAKHLLRSEVEAKMILDQYLEKYAKNPVYPPARIFMGSKELEPAKAESSLPYKM